MFANAKSKEFEADGKVIYTSIGFLVSPSSPPVPF